MTLTSASGTWQNAQRKVNLDHSPHLRYSLHVLILDNTDMASSALRRAMIQDAGERDMGSQETAHMLLGKPLYSYTYSFLCVSLDGSRRVWTGDEDVETKAIKH